MSASLAFVGLADIRVRTGTLHAAGTDGYDTNVDQLVPTIYRQPAPKASGFKTPP